MQDRHFRAGVGTVIYNQTNQVALWRRAVPPVGTWQFQQGGIDTGEQPEQTLWRELSEETGLTQTDIMNVHEYPNWTLQVYPPEILNQPSQPNSDRLGQVHKWFFLALKPDTTIDLARAADKEFDDFKWVTWDEALSIPPAYKVHVYEELCHYHKTMLQ